MRHAAIVDTSLIATPEPRVDISSRSRKETAFMRRTLIVLLGLVLFSGLTAQAAQAATKDPSPTHTTLTQSVSVKGLGEATFKAQSAKALQDPPGGGCDFSDVAGNGTAFYTDGVISSLTADWHAQVICTTTAPGQSLGGITVNSQLWHDGTQASSGTPFACTNCNLGNSPGHYATGPTGAGTYWVGGSFFFQLPAGWVWTTWPTACNPGTVDNTTLLCAATSGTMYFPPTKPA